MIPCSERGRSFAVRQVKREFLVSRFAVLFALCLAPTLIGCVPSKYTLTLKPLSEKVNGGANERIELHVVWTTDLSGRKIADFTSDEWFDGAYREYDDKKIVYRDSIEAGSVQPHVFRGPDGTVLVPPAAEIEGARVTGFVLFANYTVPDPDGVHAVLQVRSYWPFSPYAVEVLLDEDRVTTEGELATEAKARQNATGGEGGGA